jgi:hypothetical protein
MRKAWFLLLGLAFVLPAEAFPYKDSGQAVAYAMPVIAAGVTIYKKDWIGLAELTVVTGLTYGAAYGLKQIVKSCRPYAKPCSPGGSGWDSFPSTTSAIASAPSSFLWHRYGWEWGLPMFVISKYPSYALQKSKRNKLWDGLASTGIAWGLNTILTPRYRRSDLDRRDRRGYFADFEGEGDGMFVSAGYRW